ncbi:MAG: serine protein kinase RIO [Candidatus Methylarchaceae archaeon HK02M1]|nr:serine protein kinase RIO [Candidatus Methylarchaceae archaeon HK01M]MCP8311742.1 serine protein kinase RIO [Candidatus Methylarchaceae archaeon HK02M1]
MELDDKTEKKLSRRISKYEKESRVLRKDSDDYEVVEEVFDKRTLIALHHLMNSKVLRCLNGVVSSGKEARVYWGERDDGSSVAVKIYLTVTVEFKKRLPYIIGDPRFKNVKRGSRNIVELWAQKEYKNLMTVYDAGIPAPRPFAIKRNVLVMDFIGNNGSPAPLLNEIGVKQNDYRRVISLIKKLYKDANLVHADLSEYNIFKHGKRLIVFDFGSAVDVRHPLAKEFLIRDITNVNRFFIKCGLRVESLERVLKRVVYA